MNKVDELVAKVGETLRIHLNGLHSEYAVYKQTHDAILALPAVQSAIREGCTRANHQEFNTEMERTEIKREKENQVCIDVYLSTIEALKVELQSVQLENDALRLQLSTYSNPSNITLVIEEKAVSLNGKEYEEDAEDAEDAEYEHSQHDKEEIICEKENAQEKENENRKSENNKVIEEETEDEEENEEEETEDEEKNEEEEDEEEAEEEEEEEEEDEEEDENEEEENKKENEEEETNEEEIEVIEIQIKGKTYFTTNENSGIIYECLVDGDIGEEVGEFKNGKPIFNLNKSKK
jgi:hypothetical protein